MTNTIRETIDSNVPYGAGQYRSEIDVVARALETREAMLVTQLVNSAVSAGLNADSVKSSLEDLGLHMPVEVPEVEEPVEVTGDLNERITRIEDTVNRLVGLAETRLGVAV